MMNRLKSASLAAAMIISANSVCSEASAVSTAVNATKNAVVTAICNNKTLTVVVALAVMAKIRLNTKRRITYSADDFNADVKGLLNSYNIFDAESRSTIMDFIDKYVVGSECKLDETTTRTKNEDGSVFTIKGKKLTQKPFGLMGYFDAYVLQQAKKTTELVPAIAGLYLLVNDPYQSFEAAMKKPSSDDSAKKSA